MTRWNDINERGTSLSRLGHYPGMASTVMAGEDLDDRAWHSERLPDMAFDDARDSLLTGDDIYSGDWPEPVRHPSKTVLRNLQDVGAHNPRAGEPDRDPRRTGESGSPSPQHGGRLSSTAAVHGGSSSDEQQPGRGRAQAA